MNITATKQVRLAESLNALVEKRFGAEAVRRVDRAVELAETAHANQSRKDGTPFIVHPMRVANHLAESCPEADVDQIVAALLHDVLEDSNALSPADIQTEFGPDVLDLVETLTSPTENEIPDKAERNRAKSEKAAAGSVAAQRLKLVDRIDNMRDANNIDGPAGAKFRARYQDESMRYYLPMAERLAENALLADFNAGLASLREYVLRDGSVPRSAEGENIEVDARRMFLPVDAVAKYAKQQAAALEEMRRLESGEIVNTDESWQTGHYWLRDSPHTPREYRSLINDALSDIDSFYTDVFCKRFENILWIGIGGSALGPQMLYDALREPGKTPSMFFMDNTDPNGFARTFADLDLAGGFQRTLAVVVSKSGGTKETRNAMLAAQEAYEDAGVKFHKNAVAITRVGSSLDRLAKGDSKSDKPPQAGSKGDASTKDPWLARFPMWDWVGGRTSLFSPVGVLPAKLLGFDTRAFLEGARAMDEVTANPSMEKNPAMLLATTWYHAVERLGLKNMVVLPYFDRLILFSRYLQQLLMESLGKQGKGITVFGNKGSTDQHSFVQQLRDGYRDFFVTFLRVHGGSPGHADSPSSVEVEDGLTSGDFLAAFQFGTEQALCDVGRLSLNITLENGLHERSLGALVAMFERAVGFYGPMIDVNAYHQPGVEAGKAAADDVLEAQLKITRFLAACNEPTTVAEIAAHNDVSPMLAQSIVVRLARVADSGILARFDGNADARFTFENIRTPQ